MRPSTQPVERIAAHDECLFVWSSSRCRGALCPRCAALRVLELGVNADEEQIRNAHRVMSKVWHPSRFEDDAALKTAAEDKLKEINAAFDYLTSPSWIATPRLEAGPGGAGSILSASADARSRYDHDRP